MAGTTTQSRIMARPGEGSVEADLVRNHNLLVTDVETNRSSRAVITGAATWDPPSLAAGAQQTTGVTATGAALGDFALCAFSLDLQATVMLAYVSAANTVTVVHRNGTAGAIDLASGTLRVLVLPQAAWVAVAAAALTASRVGDPNGTAL